LAFLENNTFLYDEFDEIEANRIYIYKDLRKIMQKFKNEFRCKGVNPNIKQSCLFVLFVCFVCVLWSYLLDCVSLGCILGTVGKLSTRRGTWALFHSVWTYGVKDIEFQSFYRFFFFKLLLILY